LRLTTKSDAGKRTVANLNARTRAWWVMAAVFGGAIYAGPLGAVILFGLVSFFALREMLTLTPTRRADHHTLFWAFFVFVPLQYYLVYTRWYGLFSILIPVYGFLFLAIRSTLAGDYTKYLERTAKVQWGVMICVYFVSHAPALLTLRLKDAGWADGSHNWKLIVWLVVTVQMSDVLQYCWGKLFGKHKVAPNISPSKTWEGLIGGALSATALGVGLSFLTPFPLWPAAAIAFTVVALGFFGGLVMSAIKRDAGVKDYGHLIGGHGGMMDRIDSITFAAPVFFHVVRYYFALP
ncbi:MAG TPA: phosphatidate cytidylyltransferase, partial [Humisphaera sp.]